MGAPPRRRAAASAGELLIFLAVCFSEEVVANRPSAALAPLSNERSELHDKKRRPRSGGLIEVRDQPDAPAPSHNDNVKEPGVTKARFLPVLVLATYATGKLLRGWRGSRQKEERSAAASCAAAEPAAETATSALLLARALQAADAEATRSTSARTQALWLAELLLASTIFFVTGPGLIVLNKYIMSTLQFPFPILITSLGSLCLVLATQAASWTGWWTPKEATLPRAALLRLVVPLSVATCVSLIAGNAAYMYISVPLIQILKSLTLAFVLVFGCVLGTEKFSWMLFTSISAITCGISCSVRYNPGHDQADLRPLLHGFVLMLLASAAEAFKAILMQLSLEQFAFMDSLYWCSPATAILGFLLSGALEVPEMISSVRPASTSRALVLSLLASFVLGGMVTLSSFWLTKLVGSLSMKVLVTARNVAFVLLSAALLGEPCSVMQYVGYSFALIGLALYDYAK